MNILENCLFLIIVRHFASIPWVTQNFTCFAYISYLNNLYKILSPKISKEVANLLNSNMRFLNKT